MKQTEQQFLDSLDPRYFTEGYDPVPDALDSIPLDIFSSVDTSSLNKQRSMVSEALSSISLDGSALPSSSSSSSSSSSTSPTGSAQTGLMSPEKVLENALNDHEMKQSVVGRRLLSKVMQNYTDFLQGLDHIHSISKRLRQASEVCRDARRDLRVSDVDITQDLFRTLAKERKKARILAILSIFKQIKTMSTVQTELDALLERGQLPLAALKYREVKLTALAPGSIEALARVNCASSVLQRVRVYEDVLWKEVGKTIGSVARKFDETKLVSAIRGAVILGKVPQLHELLQQVFCDAVTVGVRNVICGYIPPALMASITPSDLATKELCGRVDAQSIRQAYLSVLTAITDTLYSLHRSAGTIAAAAQRYRQIAQPQQQQQQTTASATPTAAASAAASKTSTPSSSNSITASTPLSATNGAPTANAAAATAVDDETAFLAIQASDALPDIPSTSTSISTSISASTSSVSGSNVGKASSKAVAETATRLAVCAQSVTQATSIVWVLAQQTISAFLDSRRLGIDVLTLEDFLSVLLCSYRLLIIGERLTGTVAPAAASDLAHSLLSKAREYVRSFHRESLSMLTSNLQSDIWQPVPLAPSFSLSRDIKELRPSEEEGSGVAGGLAAGLMRMVSDVVTSTSSSSSSSSALSPMTLSSLQNGAASSSEGKSEDAATAAPSGEAATLSEKDKEDKSAAEAMQLVWQQFVSGRNPFKALTANLKDASTPATSPTSAAPGSAGSSSTSPSNTASTPAAAARADSESSSTSPSSSSTSMATAEQEPLAGVPQTAAARLAARRAAKAAMRAAASSASSPSAATSSVSPGRSGSLSGPSGASASAGAAGVRTAPAFAPVATSTALAVARSAGKYLSIVRDLAPLAQEALQDLGELVDFYAYTVGILHCPHIDDFFAEENAVNSGQAPPVSPFAAATVAAVNAASAASAAAAAAAAAASAAGGSGNGSTQASPIAAQYQLPTSAGKGIAVASNAGPLTQRFPALAKTICSVKRRVENGEFGSNLFAKHSLSYQAAAKAAQALKEESSRPKLPSLLSKRSLLPSAAPTPSVLASLGIGTGSSSSSNGSGSGGGIGGTGALGQGSMPVPAVGPRIVQLNPTVSLADPARAYGLVERVTAVESFSFIATVLEEIKPRLLSLIPSSSHNRVHALVARARFVALDLRAFLVAALPPHLLPLQEVAAKVQQAKWDARDLATSPNSYVNQVIDTVASMESFVSAPPACYADKLPTPTLRAMRASMVDALSRQLVDAYALIKKCSTEGRAHMSLDAGVLLQGLERHTKLRPLPNWSRLTDFITAFYYPEADFVDWMRTHRDYTLPQYLSLATLGPAANARTKQQRQDFLDRVSREFEAIQRGIPAPVKAAPLSGQTSRSATSGASTSSASRAPATTTAAAPTTTSAPSSTTSSTSAASSANASAATTTTAPSTSSDDVEAFSLDSFLKSTSASTASASTSSTASTASTSSSASSTPAPASTFSISPLLAATAPSSTKAIDSSSTDASGHSALAEAVSPVASLDDFLSDTSAAPFAGTTADSTATATATAASSASSNPFDNLADFLSAPASVPPASTSSSTSTSTSTSTNPFDQLVNGDNTTSRPAVVSDSSPQGGAPSSSGATVEQTGTVSSFLADAFAEADDENLP